MFERWQMQLVILEWGTGRAVVSFGDCPLLGKYYYYYYYLFSNVNINSSSISSNCILVRLNSLDLLSSDRRESIPIILPDHTPNHESIMLSCYHRPITTMPKDQCTKKPDAKPFMNYELSYWWATEIWRITCRWNMMIRPLTNTRKIIFETKCTL